MLCSHNFDLGQVINFFRQKVHILCCFLTFQHSVMQNGELAIYYEMESGESVEQRGIIETEHSTSRLVLITRV